MADQSQALVLYITVGVSNRDQSARFYDAVLAPLGYTRSPESDPAWVGWGLPYDDGVSFWITSPFDGKAPSPGNGTMVAFRAASAEAVQDFHAVALAQGGTDDGKPGHRPYYTKGFYAAYVRDPDGNKLACVFHKYQQ